MGRGKGRWQATHTFGIENNRMKDELVVARRFTNRTRAELARQRLVEAGLRCELISTRTSRHGEATEFGLLIDPADAGRVQALLGAEPRADPHAIRQGERALQIALGLCVVLATIWVARFMLGL